MDDVTITTRQFLNQRGHTISQELKSAITWVRPKVKSSKFQNFGIEGTGK